MLANDAVVPHESDDAISRNLFVEMRLNPSTWIEQAAVSVHSVSCLNTLTNANVPTRYE